MLTWGYILVTIFLSSSETINKDAKMVNELFIRMD